MGEIVNVNPLLMQALSGAAGTVIALFILWNIFKITKNFLDKFLELGDKFIQAQQEQARSLGAQAQSMTALTSALQTATGRDNSEHREVILLMKVIRDEVKSIKGIKEPT